MRVVLGAVVLRENGDELRADGRRIRECGRHHGERVGSGMAKTVRSGMVASPRASAESVYAMTSMHFGIGACA